MSQRSPWASQGPDEPGSGRPRRDQEGGLAEKTREKIARPPRFKVVLYNDDYTPMGFVIEILEGIFRKSPAEATALMLRIHRAGAGIAGFYVLEVAETKVATVHRLAERRGYPLRAGTEPE
jgi:ATP-dependent Clp protease adaptor protein ClpS